MDIVKLNRLLCKVAACEYAKVSNGTMYLTDLDVFIRVKTDWPDGYYDRGKLKNGQFASKFIGDVEDFPGMPEIKDASELVYIDSTLPKTLVSFCSKNLSRPALCEIGVKDGRITATDGHVLLSHKTNTLSNGLLSAKLYDFCQKNKIEGMVKVTEEYNILETPDFTIMIHIDQALGYPEWQKVIPMQNPDIEPIDYGQYRESLLQAAKTGEKYANEETGLTAFVESGISIPVDGRLFSAKISHPFQFSIGFNCRLLKLILNSIDSGTINHPRCARSPLAITNDETTALIMPLKKILSNDWQDRETVTIPIEPVKRPKAPKVSTRDLQAEIKRLQADNDQLKAQVAILESEIQDYVIAH